MPKSDFWKGKRILLTGGAGFLGQAVLNKLLERGADKSLITVPRSSASDLRRKEVAREVVLKKDVVIHLAGNVGGIGFNTTHPGQVFYDNASMALNLIDESHRAGVKKFVGIGSIVEHPEASTLPFRESGLWDGYPDAANAPYALAKRFMLAQGQFYRKEFGFNAVHLMPVKLYGPGMGFDPGNTQVVASLIQKIDEAKRSGRDSIEIWGSGKATREFLFVDDAARAIILAAERYDGEEPVNIGTGKEITIMELAETLCRLMDFKGRIVCDTSKPEGQLRSVSDASKAKEAFGFEAKTSLEDGLKKTVEWYKETCGGEHHGA